MFFWRKGYLSGMIFSNVGFILEMYDYVDFEDQFYVFKGFLNGVYFFMIKVD